MHVLERQRDTTGIEFGSFFIEGRALAKQCKQLTAQTWL
jgi:hypothetical protein